MKQLTASKEILISWRRCMEIGIRSNALSPIVFVKDELLKSKQQENSLLITIFKNCTSNLSELMTSEYMFLLVSNSGVLLKKTGNNTKNNNLKLIEGMVFSEESCGTNAVAMSMFFEKAVYTYPNHHYCEFLRKLHLYSVPLVISDRIIGYLVLTTTAKVVSKDIIAITNLLSYQLINEFRINSSRNVICTETKIKLSSRQHSILTLMARGLTEKAMAIELELSFNTVRCHKKVLFKKLGVNCSVEAVIKALELNLILID